MIIFFSGTGNSCFVAESIAKQLDDVTVSANEMIKTGEKGLFSDERPWVFVFPVYVSTMARIFLDFLYQSEFSGNRNAYFIATCAGSMGATPNACAAICENKGLVYRGTAVVQMPQNYIALFTMMDEDECKRRQEAALIQAEEIGSIIKEIGSIPTKLTSKAEYAVTRATEKLYNGIFTSTKKFYSTDACIGCGLCAQICPMNAITLYDQKIPKWEGKCVHCMACINRCPKQAIEYGKKTIGKQRYYCKNPVADNK